MKREELLRAVGEIDEELIWGAKNVNRPHRRPLRAVLIAAAVAALCLTVVWGVSAAITSYRARFVKTEEGYWYSEEKKLGMNPTYFDVDVFYDRAEDPAWRADSHAEAVADNGRYYAEMVGTRDTYHYGDKLERTQSGEIVIVETTQRHWDVVTDSGGGMAKLADMGQYEEYFHPDVNYLEATLTPVEGSLGYYSETGSCYMGGTEICPEQLFRMSVTGDYRTPSNGVLSVIIDYMPAEGFGPTIYVGDRISRREVVKSTDDTQFDVLQVRDIVVAEAVFPYGHVLIYGLQCTWDEVVDQITHLDLGDVPAVFSTGN